MCVPVSGLCPELENQFTTISALVHPPVRATIDDEMIAASVLIIIWDLISQWITILDLCNVKYQIYLS